MNEHELRTELLNVRLAIRDLWHEIEYALENSSSVMHMVNSETMMTKRVKQILERLDTLDIE
jgi:hypothetical protein